MGSDFIRSVLDRVEGAIVVNLDTLTYAANPDNLKGIDKNRYAFVKGDITDASLMKKLLVDADIVINFAAETHVDRSIHSAGGEFVRTNVQGVHVLMDALRASPRMQKFIHISTDEVWGDMPLDSTERFTEESPFKPSSLYAATKASGDLIVHSYVRTHGVPAIVTHSVNNYGAAQYPEKLIPFFVMRALQDLRLPLYGTGQNIRNWLHVNDHSEALLTVLEKGAPGEVYNISSDDLATNEAIARTILATLGKPESLLAYVADRPGHDLKYSVDSSKLRGLGWSPTSSLGTKLPEVVREIAARAPSLSPELNSHIKI